MKVLESKREKIGLALMICLVVGLVTFETLFLSRYESVTDDLSSDPFINFYLYDQTISNWPPLVYIEQAIASYSFSNTFVSLHK